MRWRVVAFAAVTMVYACGGLLGRGGSSRPYEITVNRQAYNRGSTAEATIRNPSKDVVEYNLCPRRLERRVDNNWVVAFEWPTAGGACTLELRRLEPGASVNTLFDIPAGVPTGTYRVVLTSLYGADKRLVPPDQAASPVFEVR